MLKKITLILCFIIVSIIPLTVSASSRDYNIAIDGNMSDWQDKPKTVITPYDSIYNNHEVSLLSDDSNVYFYVQMAKAGGNNTMITSEYILDIGDTEFAILMPDINNPYSGLPITNDTLKIGESMAIGVAAQLRKGSSTIIPSQYTVLNDANVKAYITRTPNDDSFVDEMEIQIPFSTLGIENSTSQTISLSNPNLGTQEATISGGSTGPIVLAVVALFLAGLGYMYKVKNKPNLFAKVWRRSGK